MNDNHLSQNKKSKKLKRVIVKEELVALTGDFTKAVILNQMVYWSERVSDFDEFIHQEKIRSKHSGAEINIQETNGWIYKTAEDLSEETMLGLSPSAMREQLKKLVSKGYLCERRNPEHRWDRTIQYRVNLIKIQTDLLRIGLCLDGYRVDLGFKLEAKYESQDEVPFSETETRFSETKNAFPETEIPFSETENGISETKIGISETENHILNSENRTLANRKAIPEITTEYYNNLSIHPSTNQDSLTLEKPNPLIAIDGRMDREVFQKIIDETGATPEQMLIAIERTNAVVNAGKLRNSYVGHVKSTAANLVKEFKELEALMDGAAKHLTPPPESRADQKKKTLMRSMYS